MSQVKNKKEYNDKITPNLNTKSSGFPYVVCLLAIWAAGGIAVPLCKI